MRPVDRQAFVPGTDPSPGSGDDVTAGTSSVVLVTATEPEPRAFGKQVVLGGLLDHLGRRLGQQQVHVVLIGRAGVERRPGGYQLHLVDKPTTLEQARAAAGRVVLPPHSPLQEAALWSPRVLAELSTVLGEIDADLEIWDTMRVGQYARAMPRRGRRILYADDLFSKRYASMLERARSDRSPIDNPLGEFAAFLPAAVRPLAAHPWAYRPLLHLERRLTARSEEAAPAAFDATALVSPEETAELARRSGSTSVRALLPLLPEPTTRQRRYSGAPVFAFLGGLDFAPNRDGLTWFLRHCREPVLAAVPDFQLLLVGRGATQNLPADARAWGEHVRPLGWVDDLDDVLLSCAGLVSPLRMGSGTKIKVLEALARGLPVVATAYGVLGLEVGRSDGCLVGGSPRELAMLLAEAAEVQTNAVLSKAAAASWAERFCPAVASRAYDELMSLPTRGLIPDAA